MENFHNISKFIKENDLDLFSDVSDDLICIICKGIMINATSAPCRCRYCYECIKEYLNGKTELFCPGSAKYCKSDQLDFQRDIHVDSIINNRISKLIVKCPRKSCEFKNELCQIKDHTEICDKRFVDCPYLQLGCNKEDVQLNNMKPHLFDESFVHNKLLIEYINNFKNDVEILKNNMKTMEDENVKLKEQIINNNLNAERKEVTLNEIIERMQNEDKNMKEEMNVLLSEIETLKSEQNTKELKNSIVDIKIKQISFEEQAANSINTLSKNSTDLLSYIVTVDKSLESTNDKLDYIKDEIFTLKDKEFVWKIDNILEKVTKHSGENSERQVFSDSFYTHKNGYKMCLYILPNKIPNNEKYLGIFFSIMKGPYDDILPWPCKIDVTTDLINQQTGTEFISRTKMYASNMLHDVYKKPICERNKSCGSLKFIKMNTLLNEKNLIKNNQLFIKCNVHVNK